MASCPDRLAGLALAIARAARRRASRSRSPRRSRSTSASKGDAATLFDGAASTHRRHGRSVTRRRPASVRRHSAAGALEPATGAATGAGAWIGGLGCVARRRILAASAHSLRRASATTGRWSRSDDQRRRDGPVRHRAADRRPASLFAPAPTRSSRRRRPLAVRPLDADQLPSAHRRRRPRASPRHVGPPTRRRRPNGAPVGRRDDRRRRDRRRRLRRQGGAHADDAGARGSRADEGAATCARPTAAHDGADGVCGTAPAAGPGVPDDRRPHRPARAACSRRAAATSYRVRKASRPRPASSGAVARDGSGIAHVKLRLTRTRRQPLLRPTAASASGSSARTLRDPGSSSRSATARDLVLPAPGAPAARPLRPRRVGDRQRRSTATAWAIGAATAVSSTFASRPRPAALLALLGALAALLAGCGAGPGKAPGGTRLTVTRDFGRAPSASVEAPKVPGSETVMRLLAAQREGDDALRRRLRPVHRRRPRRAAGGRPVDWFFYVNGVEARRARRRCACTAATASGGTATTGVPRCACPRSSARSPSRSCTAAAGKRLPVRVECANPAAGRLRRGVQAR